MNTNYLIQLVILILSQQQILSLVFLMIQVKTARMEKPTATIITIKTTKNFIDFCLFKL